MTTITTHVPNLLGGVSQQPAEIRPVNTSEDEINILPNVSNGAEKRPPFILADVLFSGASPSTEAASYAFETSDGRRWTATIVRDTVTSLILTDIDDGETIYVNLTGDDGYISEQVEDIARSFQMMSIADTLFVLNKTVIPASDPVLEETVFTTDLGDLGSLPNASGYPTGTTAETSGLYWIVREFQTFDSLSITPGYDFYDEGGRYRTQKVWRAYTPSFAGDRSQPKRAVTHYTRQAIHDTTYTLTITFDDDTTAQGSFQTPEAVDGNNDPVSINTGMIAEGIRATLDGDQGCSATVIGSTVSVSCPKDVKSIRVTDTYGDLASSGYVDAVDDFSELAPNEAEGRIVRIAGSQESSGDDYYVVLKDGRYVETVAHGQGTRLDRLTMPMLFRYDGTTFTMDTSFEWLGREVGDEDSNPDPTFIGNRINFMFLSDSRLVFLSSENMVCSELSLYENFYRSTLSQLLPTDRLDLSPTVPNTSILTHAVAFDQNIVLFSPRRQFRADIREGLTPATISIDPTTEYAASRDCTPVAVGSTILFAEEERTSRFASIMEYYREPNADLDRADSVTEAVSKYIPAGVSDIVPMTNEDSVFVLSRDNNGSIFHHGFFWRGPEKVLNSWRRWDIPNVTRVIAATSLGDDLILTALTDVDDVVTLRCNIEDGYVPSDLEYVPRLDFLEVDPQAEYSETFDETIITLNSGIGPGAIAEMVIMRPYGSYPANRRVFAKNAFADGRVTFEGELPLTDIVVGIRYAAKLTPTEFMVKSGGQGGSLDSSTGRLSLRRLKVGVKDTATFDVEVYNLRTEETRTQTFEGVTFDGSVAQPTFADLDRDQSASFAIRGDTKKKRITLFNDTPYPSTFTYLDWEGVYSPKSRRS